MKRKNENYDFFVHELLTKLLFFTETRIRSKVYDLMNLKRPEELTRAEEKFWHLCQVAWNSV